MNFNGEHVEHSNSLPVMKELCFAFLGLVRKNVSGKFYQVMLIAIKLKMKYF